MKFIFSFLFAFIFISPVIAGYNTGTTTNTCLSQSSDTCNSTPGCKFDSDEGCIQCPSGTYSTADGTTCTSCEDGFNSGWETQHKAHPDGASSCFDWICIDGFFPVDTDNDNIPDECSLCNPENTPEHAEFYNDNCDWRCIQGYYEDNNSCIQCPTGSNTTASGATMISQCQCDSGFYRGGANNDECKQCPDHSTNCTSNGLSGLTAETVECDTNYQKFESDGVVICKKCPDHSKYNPSTKSCECANGANGTFGINSSCACANNSDYNSNNNKCECTKQGYPNATYDGGVLTCSSCAENAIYDDGCKCKVGYYGNGDTNCELCPPHSTTDNAGSTSISACKCNIGYYKTETSGTVSCTECPNHSTTDDAGSTGISACKCNIGYYDAESDAESVSCTKCPIGMTTVTLVNGNPTNTTTNGATSIEHCAMLATSKFCFTNPNSTNRQLICTPLIPSSATKINDRTISTTTNSGN